MSSVMVARGEGKEGERASGTESERHGQQSESDEAAGACEGRRRGEAGGGRRSEAQRE